MGEYEVDAITVAYAAFEYARTLERELAEKTRLLVESGTELDAIVKHDESQSDRYRSLDNARVLVSKIDAAIKEQSHD